MPGHGNLKETTKKVPTFEQICECQWIGGEDVGYEMNPAMEAIDRETKASDKNERVHEG